MARRRRRTSCWKRGTGPRADGQSAVRGGFRRRVTTSSSASHFCARAFCARARAPAARPRGCSRAHVPAAAVSEGARLLLRARVRAPHRAVPFHRGAPPLYCRISCRHFHHERAQTKRARDVKFEYLNTLFEPTTKTTKTPVSFEPTPNHVGTHFSQTTEALGNRWVSCVCGLRLAIGLLVFWVLAAGACQRHGVVSSLRNKRPDLLAR